MDRGDDGGRFKCRGEECDAEFDDETERDQHETFAWHCARCGTSDTRMLSRGQYCKWCVAETRSSENQSTMWH